MEVTPICHPLALRHGGRVHWIATAPDGTFALNGEPGRVNVAGRWDLATGDTGDVSAGRVRACRAGTRSPGAGTV